MPILIGERITQRNIKKKKVAVDFISLWVFLFIFFFFIFHFIPHMTLRICTFWFIISSEKSKSWYLVMFTCCDQWSTEDIFMNRNTFSSAWRQNCKILFKSLLLKNKLKYNPLSHSKQVLGSHAPHQNLWYWVPNVPHVNFHKVVFI